MSSDAATLMGHGAGGARRIAVLPSMLAPGGVHSEVESPAAGAHLQARHPGVAVRCAWPFHLAAVARLLTEQTARCSPT